MNAIVIYKSKYGAAKTYAEWIAEELGCRTASAKDISADALSEYDTIIYGGGLYAEIIAGLTLITKNLDKLKGKRLVIYTTGLTPPDYRPYYDKLVIEKNFKSGVPENMRIFNFPGKMILDELTLPHKAAIEMLKNVMSKKNSPTEAEKLLIELCDTSGDFTDRNCIRELIDYVKA